MKIYQGALTALAMMLASTSAEYPCEQQFQIQSQDTVLLKARLCGQTINQTQLQLQPNIFYFSEHLYLNHTFTLLLLEQNKNTSSYMVHWGLTNISLSRNGALTASGLELQDYVPPRSENTSNYTLVLYKHSPQLRLNQLSDLEKKDFMPQTWLSVLTNITIQDNTTFLVSGRYPFHPQVTQTTISPPTFQPTPTTSTHVRPTPVSVGYHPNQKYNVSSNHTTTAPTSHPPKSSASSNVIGLMVVVLPIISVTLKAIF